jgi:hypothetical protein
MVRSLSGLVAAAVVVAAVAACDAQTTESCTDGPCGGSVTSTGAGGEANAADCPATPQTGDFPCDVFAVVHAQCNPCHQSPPMNGAPFPLLTYADTQKVYSPGALVFQQMFISTGPDGSPRMPFNGMLTSADYDLLHGWLGKCAPPVPAGTGCGCTSEITPGAGMGCD